MFRLLFLSVLSLSMFGYSHGADNLPLLFEENFAKGSIVGLSAIVHAGK